MKVRLVWLAFNRLPQDSKIIAPSARFALVFENPRTHEHCSLFQKTVKFQTSRSRVCKCDYIKFLTVRVTIIVISEQSLKPGVWGTPPLTTSTPTQFWRRHWCLSVTSAYSTVPRATGIHVTSRLKGEFLEIMMANGLFRWV